MTANVLPNVSIGIDLGTTFTCVGIFENGGVQILANRDGKKTTPSYVAFADDRRLIGESAKNYSNLHPEQVIYDSKRMIGRQFRDEYVQQDMRIWPFQVADVEGKPKIRVMYKEALHSYHPEEISALLLQEIKDVSEDYLGFPIKEAVITVPAYFTDAQRKATKVAGEIAGFKVLGIINEPTAAALAYGFHHPSPEDSKILVYDFGGGTFDVSLLSVEQGNFHVISTGGDSHLGGQDIDNILVKHLAREFQRVHGIELSRTSKEIRRLRTLCEKAKIELSTRLNFKLEMDSLIYDKDLSFNMTRVWFEDICEDLFRKTLSIVQDVLERGNMDISAVTDVILVGGSTRIPIVKDMLKTLFNGKEPRKDINPDEAVAYGAAIQAAILSGVESSEVRNVSLCDVTPLSLGIGTKGGVMATLIKRNTKIPAVKKRVFTTSIDCQSYIQFEVFEGERPLIKDNMLLDQFTLMGIPPAQKGVPRIKVTFDVDKDGILKVSAEDPAGEHRKSLLINSRNSLSPEAIAKAIKKAEEMKKEDQLHINRINCKSSLEIYASRIQEALKNETFREKISARDLSKVTEKLEALESFWQLRDENLSLSDIENFRNEMEEIWNPIVKDLYPDDSPLDLSRPDVVHPDILPEDSGNELSTDWYEVRMEGIKEEAKEPNL